MYFSGEKVPKNLFQFSLVLLELEIIGEQPKSVIKCHTSFVFSNLSFLIQICKDFSFLFLVIAFKSCMSAFVIRDEVSFEFRSSS